MWKVPRSTPRPPHGPLRGAGRGARIAPFAALYVAVLALYLVLYWDSLTPRKVTLLLGTAALTAVLVVAVPWDRLPQGAQVVVPLAALGLVMMMQVFALPADLDTAILMLAPLVWSALYGIEWEVILVTTLVIGGVLGLQLAGALSGTPVGLTGWTEAISLAGTAVILAYLLMHARAEARTDALTGLANRRAWDLLLASDVARVSRYGGALAVAMMDLDNFKAFNDQHGHARGDQHLAACASAWSAALRANDVLARLGGEEFAVLLLEADTDDLLAVLQRLLGATPNGQTCSIGVARWNGSEDATTLTARADGALYAAKVQGRNRLVVGDGPRETTKGRTRAALR